MDWMKVAVIGVAGLLAWKVISQPQARIHSDAASAIGIIDAVSGLASSAAGLASGLGGFGFGGGGGGGSPARVLVDGEWVGG